MKKIAIHSVPRSGSTWLGSIFDSHPKVSFKYQPLFSYAFKDYLNPNSSKIEIDDFYKEIEKSTDEFINQNEAITKGIIPKFKKNNDLTHVCYKEVRYHNIIENLLSKDKEIRIIGLVRNPCAVINSWLKAPKEFRKDLGWNELEEWKTASLKNKNRKEEFNGFEKWKETTTLFNKLNVEYPDNFKIITYDSILKNTEKSIKNIFKFCELDFLEQTDSFLKNKDSNKSAYSVFKNKKNDTEWKKELNPLIINEIESELKGTELYKYL